MTATDAAAETFVRKLLSGGRPPQFVADASGWTLAAVEAVARELGENGQRSIDHEPLPKPSAVPANLQITRPPTPPRPGSDRVVDRRIQDGLAHPSKKVQMAARRVQAALDRLANVEHEDAAKYEAKRREREAKERQREKVKQLEQQLREAREALRKPRNALRVTTSTTSRSAAPKPRDPLRYSTEVRQWARANGYTVADRGLIRAEVVEAYKAAEAAS